MTDQIDLTTLPESVQSHIRELRTEAAKHRVEKNEYKTKFEESGTLLEQANARLDQLNSLKEKAEKFEELSETHAKTLTESASLADQFNRLQAAASFGIPDHADRLKGGSLEELKADAEALSKDLNRNGVRKDPANHEQPKAPEMNPLLAGLQKAIGQAE